MTETLSLLDWQPKGVTIDLACDKPRLGAQQARVLNLMSDGIERTLREIAAATGDPEASVSARLRSCRELGYIVHRRYLARGLHTYRLAPKVPS